MLEIDGMDELMSKLEQMGNKGKAIEEKALNEGADHLVNQFKANAPVDTGQGRDSITKSKVEGGTIKVGPGNKGFYLRFGEFGFLNKRVNRRIPPRPWMGPTFEKNRSQVMNKMTDVTKRELGL